MELSKQKRKRQRRYCEHCDNELSHSQYFDHKKRFCKNGVWEKKSNNRQHVGVIQSSPSLDNKMLLTAITNLSHQLSEFAADVSREFKSVNDRLQSMEDRLAQLESNSCSTEEMKRKRRLHNPKIAEAVRRLHNSEANCRRYDPEQGLSSPYNETVTSYLVGVLSMSPEFRTEGLDGNDFVVACKTYYETVHRNFRYCQPELARCGRS
ncbi:uncharacterized protein [Garra rufa]|uniref:uncharacterized protein n=1 Tax=Garra rufa TaxID=137080 RepID=UPI003CCE79C5